MDTIADYELIRPLGSGSHGQFFLARKPGRLPVDAEFVAVKVFAASPTGDIFRRMVRELKAFAAVSSPFLVRLYDAGQHDGVCYYSMEYLPAGSLAAPAAPPVTPAASAAALRDAARAVAALHAAGMVHRDIKPANIMVADGGGKLADLGLAHVMLPGVTLTEMGPVASLEYTDPELLQGGRAGPAADMWALGVTLHWVLTGAGVYGEDLPTDDGLLALRRLLSARLQLADGLPPKARQLVEACTGPTERRPSAAEFADRVGEL